MTQPVCDLLQRVPLLSETNDRTCVVAETHSPSAPKEQLISPSPSPNTPSSPALQPKNLPPFHAIHNALVNIASSHDSAPSTRPAPTTRTVSTPALSTKRNSSSGRVTGLLDRSGSGTKHGRPSMSPLELSSPRQQSGHPSDGSRLSTNSESSPEFVKDSIPIPPLSIYTYLQLEISTARPPNLPLQHSLSADSPYGSSAVKFERLLNFCLLPPHLEAVLGFGALACLDAWLYTFTILPLRFFKAIGVLGRWVGIMMLLESREIASFVYWGMGRMWHRRRRKQEEAMIENDSSSRSRQASMTDNTTGHGREPRSWTIEAKDTRTNLSPSASNFSQSRHRRTKSIPSLLSPDHKADILKGLVVIFSCLILTQFDASRMYHGIRGQAAIKLYVIYNVLEVCDRLFSALGQDIFECLFSRETLERSPEGRSKLLRPSGMFLLALTYNVLHSTALFYQVITLNVAVNSYSNALLTLLLSNQFVEIKSTVFRRFEKESLFQLTCADIVERFQLWLMLLIIAMRNIVEVGGLTLSASSLLSAGDVPSATATATAGAFRSGSIIPMSFTILPSWTGQVLGPFLLVLGSEMLVDWLKHAYITKFNDTTPAIYGRFLDVLTKDYKANAFSDPNLTRRLGLPVLPLSCLFIRASLQTYHMFLASNVPLPLPSSSLDLSEALSSSSPTAHTAALAHIDLLLRQALSHSSFGAGGSPSSATSSGFLPSWLAYSSEDLISLLTTALFLLLAFLVLLALKLVLGMVLLAFSHRRYTAMVLATAAPTAGESKSGGGVSVRAGGWGLAEMSKEHSRHLYGDDPEGWKAAQARAVKERDRGIKAERLEKENRLYGGVERYRMTGKRIW